MEQEPTVTAPNPLERLAGSFDALLGRIQPPQQSRQLKFPDFDPMGKVTAKAWLRGCELLMTGATYDDQEVASALVNSLKGTASEWLAEVADDGLHWDAFRELFSLKYCLTDTPMAQLHQAITKFAKEGELPTYASEILMKTKGAFRGKTSEQCALLLTAALCARVDPDVRRWAYRSDNVTEVDLLKEIKAAKAGKPHKPFNRGPPSNTGAEAGGSQPQNNKRSYGQEDNNGPPQKRFRPKYNKNNSQNGQQNNNSNNQNNGSQSSQPPTAAPGQKQHQWRCWKCSKNTHDWRICFKNPRRQQNIEQNSSAPAGGRKAASDRPSQEKRVNACEVNPVGTLSHGGKEYKYLFDSGSEASLLSSKLRPYFSGQEYLNPMLISGIGTGKVKIEKQLSVVVSIDGIDVPVVFLLVPSDLTSYDIILGRDIMASGITITILEDRYEISKTNDKEQAKERRTRYLQGRRKKLPPTKCLPNNSEPPEDFSGGVDSTNLQFPDSTAVGECPDNERENWPTPCLEARIDLQVESLSSVESLCSQTPTIQGSTHGDPSLAEFHPEYEELNTDLTSPDDVDRLRSILTKYSSGFTRGLPKRAVTTATCHIEVFDRTKIINRKPYPLHPRDKLAVREYIKELLDAGIITESKSCHSSPIILVPKKNGKLRLCTDFRELNSNTVPERFPIPLIKDQINRLAGQKYFSSLDAASGFYAIDVDEESQPLTAFSTPEGHYQWARLPMGLRNSPAIYQRAITTALGDLANTFCLAYIDDLLILSSTKEDAFKRLDTVLEVLINAGFSFNPDKCCFLKEKLVYLGYEIQNGLIKPHNEKIRALKDLPKPRNVTSLKSFLGLTSYFRSFISDYGKICGPLYALTSSKIKFQWTDEHEAIRQKIISLLTAEPVLTIYSEEYPLEIWVDSSADGFGGIAFNIIDNQRRVVGYFSRKTTPAESAYHSYQLETLGAVKAFKFWENFILYRHFTLVTDCKSFQASFVKQNLIPRVQRYWAYLQCFDFTITFRPGSKMQTVDFLSRYPVSGPEDDVSMFETHVDDYPPTHNSGQFQVIQNNVPRIQDAKCIELSQKHIGLTELTGDWLLLAQQQDTEINFIKNQLASGTLTPDLANTYELKDGVLFRKFQYNKSNKKAPMIPKAYRYIVVNNIHESLLHVSLPKTLDKLIQICWFPHMHKFVTRYIQNCVTCKIAKNPSGRQQIDLHPIEKHPVPFYTVHIDFSGRLNGSNGPPEYYIVQICGFTKYVLLHHTKTLSAKAAVNAVSELIQYFGPPSRIIFDQGTAFTSKLFTDFCNSNKILLHPIATGASRANSQVERTMSSLTNMVTVSQIIKPQSIRQLAPQIQLVLNTTSHRITGTSPLELLTGKKSHVPGMIKICDDIVEPSRSDLTELRNDAKNKIDQAARYDVERLKSRTAKVIPLAVGDLVVRRIEPRVNEKCAPKFKGTYRIIQNLPGDRYLLENLTTKRQVKYPHERVRKLHNNTDVLPQLFNESENESSDSD